MMVGLVALLTGAISTYYVGVGIANQFQHALDRADLLKKLAADNVRRSLEQQPSLSVPEALAQDTDLADRMQNMMAVSRVLLEITVCDAHNRVLLSTDASRRAGDPFPENYQDYEQIASRSNLLQKIGTLRYQNPPKYYQLSQALSLGSDPQKPDLYVRVVILPALGPQRDRTGIGKSRGRLSAFDFGIYLHRAGVFQLRASAARQGDPNARRSDTRRV